MHIEYWSSKGAGLQDQYIHKSNSDSLNIRYIFKIEAKESNGNSTSVGSAIGKLSAERHAILSESKSAIAMVSF